MQSGNMQHPIYGTNDTIFGEVFNCKSEVGAYPKTKYPFLPKVIIQYEVEGWLSVCLVLTPTCNPIELDLVPSLAKATIAFRFNMSVSV